MPSTVIEVRRDCTTAEEIALIEAVQAALVEGFLIPPDDRCVRLVVHAPHRFVCPPDKRMPERYTLVTIHAFSGRSLDAKRRLYGAMVRGLHELGIPPDHVKIVLVEVPRDNWGLAGGKPASEVDLGFSVDV